MLGDQPVVLRENPITRSCAATPIVLVAFVVRVGVGYVGGGGGVVGVAPPPQWEQVVVLVNVQSDRVDRRPGADGLLVVKAEGVQLLSVPSAKMNERVPSVGPIKSLARLDSCVF